MHIELVCYGSPIKHKKFIEDLNTWEYPIEGNHRVGVTKPFICEIKLYDIRIKEEAAPQFLRDINARDFSGMPDVHSNFRRKLILFVIKILRKLMGHTEVKHAEKQIYSLPDWFYVFNVINFKDPKQYDGINKEWKEVL
jgi:hypothetical protein